jgi:hypothetical protein
VLLYVVSVGSCSRPRLAGVLPLPGTTNVILDELPAYAM